MMKVDYLRISVTDRCNLRCIYCNPLGGGEFLSHDEILRFEEIHRVVRLFVGCGVTKIRLTGGEPLVRKNVVHLVREVAGISGVEDLSLTTNGVLLAPVAGELKDAGLMRVNVSLDSVQRQNYRRITGFDVLEKVIVGIDKAIEVGLTPLRINAVVLKGINQADIMALARLSVEMPVAVRFIEYCPTARQSGRGAEFVPNGEIRRIIEEKFGTLSTSRGAGGGPALYFRIKNSAGSIGFISGRSSTFCRWCNRLRLTSDGKVRPCLYAAGGYDLRKMLRSGARDSEITALLKKIISEKSRYTKLNSFTEDFVMRCIGG